MKDTDYDLIEFLKQEEQLPITYYTMRRYLNIMEECFKGYEKNKNKIINKYINNDRAVIDKYMANDFKFLKDKIIYTRKICYNRKEIERDVNTLDFQINLLKSCETHKDFLMKNLELYYSTDYKKRREYNLDLYFDIIDYISEKMIYESEDEIYNLYVGE